MPNGDVETFHEDDAWHNQVTGHAKVEGSYSTKAEAVDAGRDLAQTLGLSTSSRTRTGLLHG